MKHLTDDEILDNIASLKASLEKTPPTKSLSEAIKYVKENAIILKSGSTEDELIDMIFSGNLYSQEDKIIDFLEILVDQGLSFNVEFVDNNNVSMSFTVFRYTSPKVIKFAIKNGAWLNKNVGEGDDQIPLFVYLIYNLLHSCPESHQDDFLRLLKEVLDNGTSIDTYSTKEVFEDFKEFKKFPKKEELGEILSNSKTYKDFIQNSIEELIDKDLGYLLPEDLKKTFLF